MLLPGRTDTMAMIFKCTKLTVQPNNLGGTDPLMVIADYYNPAQIPPVPSTIATPISAADAQSGSAIRTAVDNVLLSIGTNTMDWSL